MFRDLRRHLFRSIRRFLEFVVDLVGYEIEIRKKNSLSERNGLNLNVGSGQYVIAGFVSLDIYTDHYRRDEERNFVEYDMRADNLPYEDNSVDNIYCSHVIEHVETDHAKRFIRESCRVLKNGGVLRIACPDAEFLWHVSSFENDFWQWREPWFSAEISATGYRPQPGQRDYFIREIATPRSRFYRYKESGLAAEASDIDWRDYRETCESLTRELRFRYDRPGDHINYWDFDRLASVGIEAGFAKVIRSKPGGSVSRAMQGNDMDRTRPNMSLYVEFVK